MKNKGRTVLFALLFAVGLFGLFLLGLGLFNFVLMPLVVRQGQEVEVPDLVGLTLHQAQKQLKDAGLSGEVRATRPDSLYPEGCVVGQEPGSGTRVKVGRAVKLVVSTGPQLVRIPHLGGLTLVQAQSIVTNLSLRILTVDSIPSDSIPAGRVIGVAPPPGSQVPAGTGVELVVSLGAEARLEMPNLTGSKLPQAIKLLEEFGLRVGEVKLIPGDPRQAGMVVLHWPESGMLVAPGDTVRLIVIEGEEKP